MIAYRNTRLYREQKLAFDRIIEDVDKPIKEKPLILFVCGAAGTGKSEIIKHLLATVGQEHVLILAPTALAARNVSGKTIHGGLNLNPFGSASGDGVMPPNPSLKLLIIDEISMCDATLFRRVEARLRQLMNNDQVVFGGCTVVMFGDLLQIPPVNGQWIFKSPLWAEHVEYVELETTVRQEADPEFGSMLKRWRLGHYTPADRGFLDSLSRNVEQEGWVSYVTHFLGKYVKERNMVMLAHTNPTVGVLNYLTTMSLFPRKDQYDIEEEIHTLREDAAAVRRRTMFTVGVGSRVMINKNIYPFVNGDIGIVKEVQCQGKVAVRMKVHLPSSNTTNKLEVFKSLTTCTGDVQRWKVLIPILPAYAVTYHKAQGQTLDKVFLVAREAVPPALFYVGASRVRTREDLHVLSPNSHLSIKADSCAIAEYIRLRRSIGLSDLPNV